MTKPIDYSGMSELQRRAYVMALGTGSLALEYLRQPGIIGPFQAWAATRHTEIATAPDGPLEPDALALMDDLLAMQVLLLLPDAEPGQDNLKVTQAAGRAFAQQAEKLAMLAAQRIRKDHHG